MRDWSYSCAITGVAFVLGGAFGDCWQAIVVGGIGFLVFGAIYKALTALEERRA